MSEKKLIGITGGIGSGKSTVSRSLSFYAGLPLLDIDGICARLLGKGNGGWQLLKQHLDGSFFSPDGELDRRQLRRAIFSDSGLRGEVNSLIHPLAFQEMCREASATEGMAAIVDVPLLYEAGWQDCFDHCVVVYAHHCTCCQRIMTRDHIGLEEAERTIRSQMPLAEKTLHADHVINNSGNMASAMLEVIHLVRFLCY